MNQDSQDLREYVESGSEPAFRRLVGRHLAMVRGVALRLTRDPSLADDVAQSVFILLARKAHGVPGDRLAGWLHGATRGEARNAVRKEVRRSRLHLNYQEVMNETPSVETPWAGIAPLLDDAVGSLSAEDRELVLLRYFEDRSFAEISTATGRSVEACKKRVQRAIDRLAAMLGRRGVVISRTSLASLIAATVLQPAPASAAAVSVLAVNAASTASGAGVGAGLFLKTMTAKQISLIGVALVALAAIPFAVKESRSRDAGRKSAAASGNSASLVPPFARAAEPRSRPRNAEQQTVAINWEKLAREKFDSNNATVLRPESDRLKERLPQLTLEELREAWEKVASLDIDPLGKLTLSYDLVSEMARRDPLGTLEWLPPGERAMFEKSTVFNELVKRDIAAAGEWLEKHAAPAGPETRRDMYETSMIRELVNSDPEQAVQRLQTLPAEEQARSLVAATDIPVAFKTAMDHYTRTGDQGLLDTLLESPYLEFAARYGREEEKESLRDIIDRIPDETLRPHAHERLDGKTDFELESTPAGLLLEDLK